MELTEILGWGSPIGLGMFLACVGGFFWGLRHWMAWTTSRHHGKD